MTMSQPDTARAAVIQGLQELLVVSHVLPDIEQRPRCSTDAKKITGQLGRMLSSARHRLPLPAPIRVVSTDAYPDVAGPGPRLDSTNQGWDMASIDVLADLPDRASLRRAIRSAVRAPSVYNSQPWRWRASTNDGVDLFADPNRRLNTIDVDGRDQLVSCGAALHHLVVALAGMGWAAQVERFPDPENTHHLAHVRPLLATPSPETVRQARVIPRRRTDRRRFSATGPGTNLLEALTARAADCGTELHVVAQGVARERLLAIITRSGDLQRQQAGYAAELARWTGRYAGAGDGITADTMVAVGPSQPGEVPMRAFTRGALAQSPNSFAQTDASALMVLSSSRDDRLGALRAGEATSAVLLAATDIGLATTPLSQPMEVATTRAEIRDDIVGPQSFPQMLLRVGWPQPGCPDLPPTPRRGLDHVLAEQ